MAGIGIATWNVLADHNARPDLYPHSPPHMFQPGARRQPIIERVYGLANRLEIDLVFLQEIDGDMASQFTNLATINRWTAWYVPTRFDAIEGCLTLICGGWRVLETETLPYRAAVGNHAQRLLVGHGDDTLIDVYHTHIRWGSEETSILQRQITELIEWTEGHSRPAVIVGDLNITPATTMLADLVRSGFDDAHRTEGASTAMLFNTTKLRLDYILARGLSAAPIPQRGNALDSGPPIPTVATPSDHIPIAAKLSI
ncbi:endonuclease/exonuclease/phosphatase family protein [Nocardia colli]|uniref:endonuclease/exonuclease/phosphatase family protein n=1 Tax=Nocardia colli TaxID=2545717 RepID=UPI0035E3A5E4